MSLQRMFHNYSYLQATNSSKILPRNKKKKNTRSGGEQNNE